MCKTKWTKWTNSHHFFMHFSLLPFVVCIFFFHYKLLHPSFFSPIKSTVCPISTVVIAHFYTLFFSLSNLSFVQHPLFHKYFHFYHLFYAHLFFFCIYFIVRLTPILFLSDQIYRLSNIHNFYCSLLPFNL